jgi:hypothetical protein
MRYFFHIFDGPKVFPDEVGSRFSSPEIAKSHAKAIAAELCKAGELCRSNLVFVLDEKGKNIFSVPSGMMQACQIIHTSMKPTAIPKLKKPGLAPRGCLVRVTSAAHRFAPGERWFAVGIYFQKMAEAAVCDLPQVESDDVVFAYRRLEPAEIVTLGLRRGQIVLCDGPFWRSKLLRNPGSFSTNNFSPTR